MTDLKVKFSCLAPMLAACALATVDLGLAADSAFSLKGGEQQRVILRLDELPAHWQQTLGQGTEPAPLARVFKDGEVRAIRFHRHKIMLLVAQPAEAQDTKVYISTNMGHDLELMHFAQPEAAAGLKATDELWNVALDLRAGQLSTTTCGDAQSFGCNRSTYHYNGRNFILTKVEASSDMNTVTWKPVWTAQSADILPSSLD